MKEDGDTFDNEDLWAQVEAGDRGPVDILYLVADESKGEFEEKLEEIVEFGLMTGWWEIQVVSSVEEAIRTQRFMPADMMILLNGEGAHAIAKEFPSLPLSVATQGGWDRFPSGYPSQVVVAQWAAPRPGDFADSIAEALRPEHQRIIYEAAFPEIRVYKAVSEELLARLAEFPEERFSLNPRLFEETVAELLERMGYSVQLTPQSGDKGRDIIASIGTSLAPQLILVECKRYSARRLVGPEPITRIWSRVSLEKANMGMVVTTSGFQKIAHTSAEEFGYQMSLKDGEQFIRWVHELRHPLKRM